MMKTMIMISSGVVTKTGVHVDRGDVTIMGQNVKASALCKNVSNFQFLMHEATFPLQKKEDLQREEFAKNEGE
jgi:PHD/YefM family antitoxin component YafN of YafNO toxin-antitoxin module